MKLFFRSFSEKYKRPDYQKIYEQNKDSIQKHSLLSKQFEIKEAKNRRFQQFKKTSIKLISFISVVGVIWIASGFYTFIPRYENKVELFKQKLEEDRKKKLIKNE